MKCHPYNVRYEKCCTCKKLAKCQVFASLTKKQHDAYVQFILDNISRHPEKYELGVVMAEQKPIKNIMLMDKPLPSENWTTMPDLEKMSDSEKLKLAEKEIYLVAKKYKAELTVKFKQVPLEAGASRKETGKPRRKRKE